MFTDAGVSDFMAGAWIPVEKSLTHDQQFRLIEIAHETKHEDVRVAALKLLLLTQHPRLIMERQ